MPRRLSGISLALLLVVSGEVWALGLGDIRLDSALNEPLRAEIELLSATPEEVSTLQVSLASAATFERYGIDRPFYLQNLEFDVTRGARAGTFVIEVRSTTPMTEPFLTFLVEATWPSGRLLREYTVLLDPPTYRPPQTTRAPAPVTAPRQPAPADSGRIERPAPRQPAPPPRQAPRATPPPSEPAYDTTAVGEIVVRRGDTLWGIAQRARTDSRLTMNQMMVGIYEANPSAFGGNINLLKAGARMRIPSADQIYRISRGEAFSEVARQNEAWRAGTVTPPAETTRPSLTLVPPDEGVDAVSDVPDTGVDAEPLSREEQIVQRIEELEAEVPDQPALIEIRDNELARLREELANIRGEVYEPPIDEPPVDEPVVEDIDTEPVADVEDIVVDDAVVDDVVPDDAAVEPVEAADTAPPPDIIRRPAPEPSLIDRAVDFLGSIWAIVIGALLIAGAVLIWFVRRGGEESIEAAAPWQQLDAEDREADAHTATETLGAPQRDEAFVVVEQESVQDTAGLGDTIETPAPAFADAEDEETGTFGSLEDTFSSDTAVNLDESDPIAEADFHMAYGLYDQAADLVNGALAVEPARSDLLSKLCEIYFVWGNRDAFVDAAERLKGTLGDGGGGEWDKTVIMGQQIAPDHALFAGATAGAAAHAVDLSLEGGMGDTGALDMEFIADAAASTDFIDLGGEDASDIDMPLESGSTAEMPAAVDFDMGAAGDNVARLDTAITEEVPTIETTVEMPEGEATVESPTIEQELDTIGGTAELPAISEEDAETLESVTPAADQTAEINLDDLGLDLDAGDLGALDELDSTSETRQLGDIGDAEDLEATSETRQLADVGEEQDLEATSETPQLGAVAGEEDLDATSETPGLEDADLADITGKNPRVDPTATGVQRALAGDDTAVTSEMPAVGGDDASITTDVEIDSSLLDATGMTQVLSGDMAVDTTSGVEDLLGDEDATLLAGVEDATSEIDFDFAKTEALPKDAFEDSPDATGEMPAIATTDMDLDLDDLTAALNVSEMAGDTLDQPRDEATVQQPRPGLAEADVTMELGPGDMDDDLQNARTMTEVGTKLDLARAYIDMGDPDGARSILGEVLDEGDEAQRQQAQQLLDSLSG